MIGEKVCDKSKRGKQEETRRREDSHVEDTVSDDLGVDRDLVGSLRQSPDDRVSGPEAAISTPLNRKRIG